MRKACVNCCRKHLGQACVLAMEARKGYPVHAWYAIGHLAEAEDEILELDEAIAARIREHRVLYMQFVTEGGPRYDVPYEELILGLGKYDDNIGSTPIEPTRQP